MTMNCDSLMNTYSYLPVNLVKGNGSYLYDDNDNKYIDFTSGIGVNSLGYSHPKWVESITNEATKIQHISNIFLNKTTLNLANKLTEISNMNKIFFCNSGAEANEGAIKLARKYSFEKYGLGRHKILSLNKSFHGRTLATLTATGQEKFHNYFFPFPEGFDYFERDNINSFKEKATSDTCAVIMEAIQGEGGVNELDKDFVKYVVNYCKSNDILVIFDEVQCGIGRTGKLFGFNHFNVEADIITLAKGLGGGLPIGCFLCNSRLSDVFKAGDHGTTYGGNPISCAGALTVLDEICNFETLQLISENGAYFRELLSTLDLPIINTIRGKGLMIGIETSIAASVIQQKALEKGLLLLTAGENVIRLLPPLIINKNQILEGFNILSSVLMDI